MLDDEDDEDELGEFECPECGEELDEDDTGQTERCPAHGEEPFVDMSDRQARQHERRQMGIES